jgi:aminoglycoside 3-N-acetyltransferase I
MTPDAAFTIHRLTFADTGLMPDLLEMFGQAFGEADTYGKARPCEGYYRCLLGGGNFIALAAVQNGAVIGGLAA